MAKVNVRDISRVTGYSPATVSNALNHKRNVSEETAKVIRETAQAMGYQQPSLLKTIQFVQARKNGKIIDESTFHPAVIEGVEQQAKRHGMTTTFVTVDFSDLDACRLQVEALVSNPSAALILLGTELMEEDYDLLGDVKAHLVVLDGWSERHDFDAVLMANEDSSGHATAHLLERGHTKIGYLAGDFRIHNFQAREHGYARTLRAAGIQPDPRWRVELGTTLETAYADMSAWLDSTSPDELPTAFFADNDVLAVGAMRALAEHGVRVPDDVSIVGFDDISMCAFSDPPLTTIHVLKHEVGQIAVEQLVGGMDESRDYTCKTQVSTYLVERGSVRDLR